MKYFVYCITFFVILVSFVSCSNNKSANIKTNSKKISIVTTIFPEYDWVKNIIGDKFSNFDITMLYNTGTDLHSYQPSADDIIKISNSDIFIYVGGESDKWIDEVLEKAVNKNITVINLLNLLGELAKEEETVEGMQKEKHHHEHGHKHREEPYSDHDKHHDNYDNNGKEEEHEKEYDEHVWLSLRNAKIFVKKIAEVICIKDSANANTYKNNVKDYIDRLTDLDLKYKHVVDSSSMKTILFGDRFPFRYLVDDYGLKYFAAFAGCSAESEASFETIIFLAKKVDELKLNTILTIEGNRYKIAQTIIQNTKSKNQKIAVINSMQSITAQDIEKGISYISIMEQNIDVLSQSLK